MNKRTHSIYISFLLVSFSVQAQFKQFLSTPFPAQYHAADSMVGVLSKLDSNAATKIIHRLGNAVLLTGNHQIELGFKRLQFKYAISKYYSNRNRDDSTINVLVERGKALLASFKASSYPEVAAEIHMLCGNLQYSKELYRVPGFKNYLTAFNIVKKYPRASLLVHAEYLQYMLAVAYYEFKDYKKALDLLSEDKALFPSHEFPILNIDIISMAHFKMHHYDSAMNRFKWILKNEGGRETIWTCIGMGNMGLVYFEKNQYDSALAMLYPAVRMAKEAKDAKVTATYAYHVGLIHWNQKNLEEAVKYFNIAVEATHREKIKPLFYDLYVKMAEYHTLHGSLKTALTFRDSASIFKEIFDKENDVSAKFVAEQEIENEKMLANERELEQRVLRLKTIRNSLILIILSIGCLVFVVFRNRRLKHLLRQEQLTAEKTLAENELSNAKIILENYTQHIYDKNELIDKASLEINQLKEFIKENQQQSSTEIGGSSSEKKVLNDLQESNLLTDEDWKKFILLFETAFPGYIEMLQKKYNGISPAELRYLILLKLNLNIREMASMLNLTPEALRKTKSRLNKKFDISEHII